MAESASAWLVLDTNAALDLYVFDDPRLAPLADALDAGRLRLATDPECAAEWCAVLAYPSLGLDQAVRERAAARYAIQARVCPLSLGEDGLALPRCRDSDDQKFLRLAAAVAARALLTRDAELLRLAPRVADRFAIQTPQDWCRAAIAHPA